MSTIRHPPRILALDGGGVRGLSSLLILKDILDEVKRRMKAENTPLPCEYFDLIGGTSTGGLIAIMLGRLRMSVESCIRKYVDLAEKVFKVDQVIQGVPVGSDGCRFDCSILEDVVKLIVNEKLEDEEAKMASYAPIGQNHCATFVVATIADAAEGPPVLFRSYGCKGHDASQCKIWEAARATTAAPSYFKHISIEVSPSAAVAYVDGGMAYNNPSELALAEAKKIWTDIDQFCLVSIGTGKPKNVQFADVDLPPSPSQTSSLYEALTYYIPMLVTQTVNIPAGVRELKSIAKACVGLSTNSEKVHRSLLERTQSRNTELKGYHRFNVERFLDQVGLQEWQKLPRLMSITSSYMSEEEVKIKRDACVVDLLKPLDHQHLEPGYFMMRIPRNDDFTGREGLLKVIREKFCNPISQQFGCRIALHGLGGVGKTQIAIEYVYRFREQYNSIYWINGADKSTILSGFRKIARTTACVRNPNLLDSESIARDVNEWLQMQANWLFVLDNLDDFSVIGDYSSEDTDCLLPNPVKGGHILITTRNAYPIWIRAQGLLIDELDVEDATTMLISRAQLNCDDFPEIITEAKKIVEVLGYLPLAIEQAAAFIREHSHNIFEYVSTYLNQKTELLQRVPPNYERHHSVLTTWKISFEKIQAKNPCAAKLLQLFAYLFPDGISLDFLRQGRTGLPDDLKDILSDQIELYRALNELEQYSLIRRFQVRHMEAISMHRLVQTVIRLDMSGEQYSTLAEIVIGLFEHAIPEIESFSPRQAEVWLTRYLPQFKVPLFTLDSIKSERFYWLIKRVRKWFLRCNMHHEVQMCASIIYRLAHTMQIESNPTLATDEVRMLFPSHRSRRDWRYIVLAGSCMMDTYMKSPLEEYASEKQKVIFSDLENLANAFCRLGAGGPAVALLEEVLLKIGQLHGEEGVDKLPAMIDLAEIYALHEQPENAQTMYDKIVEIANANELGLESPYFHSVPLFVLQIGKFDYCEKLCANYAYRNADALSPVRFATTEILAFCFWFTGHGTKAIELVQNLTKILLNSPNFGESSAETQTFLILLIFLYEVENRHNDLERTEQTVADLKLRGLWQTTRLISIESHNPFNAYDSGFITESAREYIESLRKYIWAPTESVTITDG